MQAMPKHIWTNRPKPWFVWKNYYFLMISVIRYCILIVVDTILFATPQWWPLLSSISWKARKCSRIGMFIAYRDKINWDNIRNNVGVQWKGSNEGLAVFYCTAFQTHHVEEGPWQILILFPFVSPQPNSGKGRFQQPQTGEGVCLIKIFSIH